MTSVNEMNQQLKHVLGLHWQFQSQTTQNFVTGRRLIQECLIETKLFVREKVQE
jgi:hypothetical protein